MEEEEHGGFHRPDKCSVGVPCCELEFGAVFELSDVERCEGLCLPDYACFDVGANVDYGV